MPAVTHSAVPVASRVPGLGRPFAGVLLYATGPVLIGYSTLVGPSFAFWRLLAGIPALLASAAFLERSNRDRTWVDHRGAIIVGGVFFGANQVLIVYALRLTTVAEVTVVAATLPLLTGIGAALLLKERQRPLFWTGAAVAVVGTVVIWGGASQPSGRSIIGLLLAFGAIVAFAGFLLTMKRAVPSKPLTYLAAVNVVSWVLVAGLTGVMGVNLAVHRLADVVCVVIVAVISGSLGHALFVGTMEHQSPVVLSSLKLLQPIAASSIAWVVLGQTVENAQWLGAFVVLLGVAVGIRGRSDVAPRPSRNSIPLKGSP